MDFLPFAAVTADKAMRRHFDGGRVDSTTVGPRTAARASATTSATASSPRGTAALRARVAGILYRGASAVEPCGYQRPATH